MSNKEITTSGNINGNRYRGKVGIVVGTGRCGTYFWSKILQREPAVSSVHERNPLNETFHRYAKWYNLPIDNEGFVRAKETEIVQDLKNHSFSFEASAHLSLSIAELYRNFDAKIILMVRSPELVVNSYLKKGWYSEVFIRSDSMLALGYQNNRHFHQFLGRIVPSGKEFEAWNNYTRVGKLAWYWNNLNGKVIELFQDIPRTHWRVQKLEEMNSDKYLELCIFMGIKPTISNSDYKLLTKRRPNAIFQVPTIKDWSSLEIDEFEREVAPMATKLEYPYKVSELPIYKPKIPTTQDKIIKKIWAIKKLVQRR